MSTTNHSKLLVILGPTSSGKSALAIDIARQYNGEVISADSRQVYRGMDIGTGKVLRDKKRSADYEVRITEGHPNTFPHSEIRKQPASLSITSSPLFVSEGIPHHLIDIADPNDNYNVSHFVRDAHAAIEDISHRGKLPILCGGTGFWIQALVEGQSLPNVPPNPALRRELSLKTKEELFEMLSTLDPKRAQTIDRDNPRRLIRAIEIAQFKEQEPGDKERKKPASSLAIPSSLFSAHYSLILALAPPKEILDEKIRTRLEARFDGGMIEEVERLHKEGVSWERLDTFGLEYRWISQYLQKYISLEEMKEKLAFDIIHYAKRQLTWIRRWQKTNQNIHISETAREAKKTIEEFLNQEKQRN